ncbi:MAG TPA: M56 family metallopeptidase [Brevundimonas sp.]|uniref:M56 family metallopeptidase n=1 Tax=Brevundimonas sp. TaxID=1871086 RepID=UPI0026285D31|nr:M56 family metallopeptidase [Brevundimonas sp.]HRO32319.1 M56 family metallopeptidase [Brevundimonas sp.]
MIAALTLVLAKSVLFAGLALGLTALMRRRPAAERVEVLRAALVALAVLPLIALAGPDLALRVLEPATATATVGAPEAAPEAALPPAPLQTALTLPRATVTAQITPPPAWVWIAAAWSLGALLIAGRFVLGVAVLARWSRRGRPVEDARWVAPLNRLAPRRAPSLRVSAAVAAPLSWGLPPGRILIAPAQLARPDQAEAVLAHELAHIRRADWLFLALSRLVTALFWFNPLVWLVAREMERLSEHAVDEAVVRHLDRETYARILVGMAAQSSQTHLPAVGMTGPARSLAQRIKLVMSDPRPAPARPWIAAAAIAAVAAVAAPVAALEFIARDPQVQDAYASPAPATVSAAAAEVVAQQAQADAAEPVRIVDRDERREVVVIRDGDALSDAERAAVRADVHRARAEARQAAHEARAVAADHARRAEQHGREAGRHARSLARLERLRSLPTSGDYAGLARLADLGVNIQAQVDRAVAEAANVRVDTARIQEEVARELAAAQVELVAGGDEMIRGARQMRQEADRMGDPAYRARKIREARARGETVTDQDLIEAIPHLRSGADSLERAGEQLRTRTLAQVQAPARARP